MQQLQQFLQYEHSNEVLMAVGAILLTISIFSIVRMGFKLAMWVLVASLGATSLSYGMRNSSYDLPLTQSLNELQVSDLKDLAGKNNDVLQFLCQKLDQASQ